MRPNKTYETVESSLPKPKHTYLDKIFNKKTNKILKSKEKELKKATTVVIVLQCADCCHFCQSFSMCAGNVS